MIPQIYSMADTRIFYSLHDSTIVSMSKGLTIFKSLD